MALLKLTDTLPNYREIFGEDNIISFSIYSIINGEKNGTINDILLDENEGKFRYLIIDLGFWIFSKQVLLPIGLSQINFSEERAYTTSITQEQAENLPRFNHDLKIDRNYEEQVRNVYSITPASSSFVNPVVPFIPIGPMTINQVAILNEPMGDTMPNVSEEEANEAGATYNYHHYPDLYELSDTDHPRLKLYEGRLFANKKILRQQK
ncbi:PRC-barrel domain-containing protein [Nostoc sp. MG11]|uniref:PRC-barrel domain-containing protein n=1 Tax=Nostoc sp. MG11 TaxID=2721166 RepID=UPI001868884A|nr:PRC-barrel domain-containing protein [Nostoc sp. MG11]